VHQRGLRLPLFFLFAFVLAALAAFAQDNSPAASPVAGFNSGTSNPGVNTPNIPSDTPVITMDGYCDPASPIGTVDKTRCRTVITRAEFERIASAQGATIPSSQKQFAAFYVQYCLFAREAHKQGLDKEPRAQEMLEVARVQTLSQLLIHDLQAKSQHFAPGDAEKFFREHQERFEKANFLRVFIPINKFRTVSYSVHQPIPESAAEMKQLADDMYSRARGGADFVALQAEARETSNLVDEETANYDNMSRDQLRKSHQVVFDLKAGEFSPLFHEEEGYYFYKMLSKSVPPFDSVKLEVERALQKQRMDDWIGSIAGSAQVSMSEGFFGSNPLKRP
jgi:hypothetical protein